MIQAAGVSSQQGGVYISSKLSDNRSLNIIITENNEPTSAMKKTLLLCFIHGFKGDDNTFGEFPENLKTLVAGALPKVDVQAIVYPKFETRGDLKECVARFRDWYVLLTLLCILWREEWLLMKYLGS
jgi:hypothetical protein